MTEMISYLNFHNESIKFENFDVNTNYSFDGFFKGYSTEWVLRKLNGKPFKIYEKLPFALHDQYINDFKQFFEPSNFYRNVVTICSIAEKDLRNLEGYLTILYEYIEHALSYSMIEGKTRFVVYEFNLKRTTYCLKKPWVSAIGNAFVIRALTRIYLLNRDKYILSLIREYSRPFFKINSSGKKISGKWFTWVDEDNFLWFDEYPGDDGWPSLVLNGHIHSLYALHCLLMILPEGLERQSYLDLLRAGLTTMKHNSLKFRRAGKFNSYSLREKDKDDYLPDRTVRQQLELHKMTGESVFKMNAEIFSSDIMIYSKNLKKFN